MEPITLSERRIVERLLRFGLSTRDGGSYTDNRPAERFFRTNWNARLVGVIFDQSIPYRKAWQAPYMLKRRLGHFNMKRIGATPVAELRRAIRQRPALHRYVGKLPVWIKAAASKLVKEYGGEAANIWRGCLTAGEVIRRLDDFPGIGQKKAHMAARAPRGRLRVPQLEPDQHGGRRPRAARRVWKRAGLMPHAPQRRSPDPRPCSARTERHSVHRSYNSLAVPGQLKKGVATGQAALRRGDSNEGHADGLGWASHCGRP